MGEKTGEARRLDNLPGVLKSEQGERIDTPEKWETRRKELLRLFRQEVYGRVPEEELSVSVRVTETADGPEIMGGQAIRKTVEVEAQRKGRQFCFSFVVFLPKGDGPHPLFLTICNRGIRDSDPSRDFLSEFWPAEMIVARGYAAAVFRTQEVAPDYAEGFQIGFHRLFPEYTDQRPPDCYGAIGAWSWAASRVIDYAEKEPLLDERRIAVVGHSRGGKTALWTAAQDSRVAMAAASCAGNTGDALSRGNTGERIADITRKFPYWFCPRYSSYSGREEELPVDQHMLLGLIAPRLLYTSAKTRDAWADPEGQFASCVEASRVYELYGVQGLETSVRPLPEHPLHGGRIGHHIRTGDHEMDLYDWERYLDFADRHLME